MAYREPGATLIVPAVMHWKVGHFAAIIKESRSGYQVEDPTFGENITVTSATLDREGSGYFVVPPGPLPAGWRRVPVAEGDHIWGRGYTQGSQPPPPPPPPPDPPDEDCDDPNGGMTTAGVLTMAASLTLHDVPIHYHTSKGPAVRFELFYMHRDTQQPAIFTYTNFGPKWTSNWIGYFTDNTSINGTASLYAPGGGLEVYGFFGLTSNPGLDDEALVTRLVAGGNTTGFTRELPDGSLQTYGKAFGTNQFFLSSIADPQGNQVTLAYDTKMRITTITDAAGLKTTLTYGLASDPLQVTKVTDPFGRSATFTYNSDGELASVTDVLGITSSYAYVFDSGDFVSSLTTPYGVSKFTYGDATTDYYLGTARFVNLTDPLGQTERVEYRQNAPGITDTDPPNTVPAGMNVLNEYLSYRDTYVWDKHQYPLAQLGGGSLDYTKATMYHYLHGTDFNQSSAVLESVKPPLEHRIWFNYANQSLPIQVGTSNQPSLAGRVLDDGTTQLLAYQRNSFGHVTQFTDPIGRQLTMTYDPTGIDLLTIANTTGGGNQLLFTTIYKNHEPLSITDPAGQVSKFTYNPRARL